jgi:hypothetical protein
MRRAGDYRPVHDVPDLGGKKQLIRLLLGRGGSGGGFGQGPRLEAFAGAHGEIQEHIRIGMQDPGKDLFFEQVTDRFRSGDNLEGAGTGGEQGKDAEEFPFAPHIDDLVGPRFPGVREKEFDGAAAYQIKKPGRGPGGTENDFALGIMFDVQGEGQFLKTHGRHQIKRRNGFQKMGHFFGMAGFGHQNPPLPVRGYREIAWIFFRIAASFCRP